MYIFQIFPASTLSKFDKIILKYSKMKRLKTFEIVRTEQF